MSTDHQFQRLALPGRAVLHCEIDGLSVTALAGDTVLTAVMASRRSLREFEFSATGRAGFCFMGACQDCWVHLEGGERLRACSTPVAEGMRIVTTSGRRSHG